MFECDTCDRLFSSEHAAVQHMNALGHWAPRFDCEACDDDFPSKAEARHHMDANNHWRQFWCGKCQKGFQNENNLNMHLRGKAHLANSIKCPFCGKCYTTASGLVHHLETGSCPRAPINRETLYRLIREKDVSGIITKKLIGWDEEANAETVATIASWDESCYRCYLCGGGFRTLRALNQHLQSPKHKQSLYHCFGRSCGKEFTSLAALYSHLESESCGASRFATVQKSVNAIRHGRMLMF